MRVRISGAAIPSTRSPPSLVTYSRVFATNAWSWAVTPACASAIAARTVAAVSRWPVATASSPRYSVSPCSRTAFPSDTSWNTSGPAWSSSGIPASTRSCGPVLGYRPLMLAAALTTAAACRCNSASALTRSRSSWSMMAISPGVSRLVRFFVRRSRRAGPLTPGRSSALGRGVMGRRRNWAIIESHPARNPGLACAITLIPYRDQGQPGYSARWVLALRTSGGEQLTGVRPAELGVFEPGQHPGQLAHPALVVQPGDTAADHRAVAGLLDDQVGVRERGHLRQVGDHDHLGAARQPGQPAPDLDRGLPAHAGVHLVEHERRHRVGAGEHDLDGEHYPGQFAPRGSLGQRQGRGAGVRGQPDFHLVRAVRAELVLGDDCHGDLRVRHGQHGQLRRYGGREPVRGILAQRGQLPAEVADRLGQPGLLLAERADPVVITR